MLFDDDPYKSYASDKPGVIKMTLRKAALSVLRLTAFDIKIRHHLTKSPFLLNTYNHKGYWFYGKNREADTIERFREYVTEGMAIIEVGGHIGYFSVLFSELAGSKGLVYVFEPGINNLKYLIENSKHAPGSQIIVEELAAGNVNSEMEFYLDPLTGQNNTLVSDFEGFKRNRYLSAEPNAQYIRDTVRVVRLDDYFEDKSPPDFVKIDIEGYEWECIDGFRKVISSAKPVVMVEIQRNESLILNFFAASGYRTFNDKGLEINGSEEFSRLRTPNIFFVPDKNNV